LKNSQTIKKIHGNGKEGVDQTTENIKRSVYQTEKKTTQ